MNSKARQHRVPRHFIALVWAGRGGHPETCDPGHQEERRAGAVIERCAKRVEQPAQRGADQNRELPGKDMSRDAAAQDRPRHHDGDQRLHHGQLEDPHGGMGHQQHVDRRDARHRKRGDERQPEGRAECQRIAVPQDRAPIEVIYDLPGRQQQHQRRQNLDKTDHAQMKWAVRELVNMPANDHSQHLGGRGGGHPRDEQQAKRADAKQRRRWIDRQTRDRRRVAVFRVLDLRNVRHGLRRPLFR